MTLSNRTSKEVDSLINGYSASSKKRILSSIHKLVMHNKPAPRTISSRYSTIKKKFKSKVKDPAFLKMIRPDPKITESIIKQNAEIRDKKKLINITPNVIKSILSFESSSNPYELGMYLLFVSGRRTSELLTAKFSSKGNKVRIRGVRKRTDDIDCYFEPLIRSRKFIMLYKKFMNMHNISYKSFQRTLDHKIKRYYGPNYHAHMLRGMYAMYAYHFRNTEQLKINTFIRDKLCHQSINSSLNYTQYKIDPKLSDIVR